MQDMPASETLTSPCTKEWEFMVVHDQSGRSFPGIESCSIPGTLGENSGQSTAIQMAGMGAGYNSFSVLVRRSTWSRTFGLGKNPEEPSKDAQRYHTTARFHMAVLSRMR